MKLIEVVQQPPRLVLFDVEPGETDEAALVVTGIHDLGLDGHAGSVGRCLHRHLTDVEAEFVEAFDALGDAPGLSCLERLDLGELPPQGPVCAHDPVGDLDGVDTTLKASAGLEVHDLAGDVGARDVEVVLALPGRESVLVQLAGLCVHEIGGEGSRVAAEERVRQRHIAPEEPDIVEAHQQHREGVDQSGCGSRPQHLGEQGAVREGELQVRGDQGGR